MRYRRGGRRSFRRGGRRRSFRRGRSHRGSLRQRIGYRM